MLSQSHSLKFKNLSTGVNSSSLFVEFEIELRAANGVKVIRIEKGFSSKAGGSLTMWSISPMHSSRLFSFGNAQILGLSQTLESWSAPLCLLFSGNLGGWVDLHQTLPFESFRFSLTVETLPYCVNCVGRVLCLRCGVLNLFFFICAFGCCSCLCTNCCTRKVHFYH